MLSLVTTQMVFLVITHCEELRYYGPFEEKEAQAHREEIRRVRAGKHLTFWSEVPFAKMSELQRALKAAISNSAFDGSVTLILALLSSPNQVGIEVMILGLHVCTAMGMRRAHLAVVRAWHLALFCNAMMRLALIRAEHLCWPLRLEAKWFAAEVKRSNCVLPQGMKSKGVLLPKS
eukprot:44742-Pelagomonas_calceolata.AAC.2